MQTKLHIKKGDIVKVITGDSKGQEGKVLFIHFKEKRAIVEGINLIHKHTKPNAKNSKGGIIKKESSIHLSNLMVVDSAGNPTRINRKMGNNNKRVRFSKKNEEEIK